MMRDRIRPYGFIALAIFIGWLEYNSVPSYLQDKVAKDWPQANGVVLEINSCTPVLKCAVLYSYKVDEIEYKSKRISFTPTTLPKGALHDSRMRWVHENYIQNQNIKVHFNPDNPKTSVLLSGQLGYDYLVILIIMGFVMVVSFIYGINLIIKHNKSSKSTPKVGAI